jgi:hypothetical protein
MGEERREQLINLEDTFSSVKTSPEFIYEIREHMMTLLWHHYFHYVGEDERRFFLYI